MSSKVSGGGEGQERSWGQTLDLEWGPGEAPVSSVKDLGHLTINDKWKIKPGKQKRSRKVKVKKGKRKLSFLSLFFCSCISWKWPTGDRGHMECLRKRLWKEETLVRDGCCPRRYSSKNSNNDPSPPQKKIRAPNLKSPKGKLLASDVDPGGASPQISSPRRLPPRGEATDVCQTMVYTSQEK